ncbi:MAG TPA: peptidylprolyl isomerase [Methylomirabilota bacterium]|nr:peptidylprolyl isomerase [Methylomirabilota bacterium]
MRHWLRWLTALALVGALAGCRGTPPALPPVPATSGSLLLPAAAAPAVPPDQSVVDRVVAVVNEDVIMMSELQEALILYLRETKEAAPATSTAVLELQQKVLTRMVEHRLQVQEARREKVEVTDEEVQQTLDDFVRKNGGDRPQIEEQLRGQGLTWEGLRREMRDQLMVQKIRSRRVTRRANVTESEVDAYVAANRDKLEHDLKYRPRHIAVLAEPPDSGAAWERAKAEAEALAVRLRNGADFAELAQEYSKDGSAAAGGDLGWLRRGELQALFEEPILRLGKGEVTEPVRSAAGYHLFKLEDREEVTPEMLAQLRQQARDILLQRKAQARFDEWVQRLREKALIVERL